MTDRKSMVDELWVKQLGEEDKKYEVKRVEAPGYLNGNETRVLYHLSKAVDAVNPVFIDQTNPEYPELMNFLDDLKEAVEDDLEEAVEEYERALVIQNGPYNSENNRSLVLDVPEEEIRNAISDSDELQERYRKFKSILQGKDEYDGKGSFYPESLDEENMEDIEGAEKINTRIVETEGGYKAVKNEDIYSEWIGTEIIPHLERAIEVSEDGDLVEYLESKVRELRTGNEEDRMEAHRRWLDLGPDMDEGIDLILGLSNETYQDKFKGIKGSAEAILATKNKRETERWKRIVELIPQMEEANTYSEEYKKNEGDFDTSSELVAYDVVRWSGFNVKPATLIGKSWPDEGDFGSRQMLFDNICELVFSGEVGKVLLVEEDYDDVKGHIQSLSKLFTNLHEQGHSTGVDVEDAQTDSLKDLKDPLEEARADLVAMNSISILSGEGVIEEDVPVVYKALTVPQAQRLMYDPVGDYAKSRNLIFHYLEDNGAVEEKEGKFKVNPREFQKSAGDLLEEVGNIRFSGDRERAEKLFGEFVYKDPRKEELAERMREIPQGRGFIFPRFKENGEIEMPDSFKEETCLRRDRIE